MRIPHIESRQELDPRADSSLNRARSKGHPRLSREPSHTASWMDSHASNSLYDQEFRGVTLAVPLGPHQLIRPGPARVQLALFTPMACALLCPVPVTRSPKESTMRKVFQASFLFLITAALGGCGPEVATESTELAESTALKSGTVVQELEGSPGMNVDITASTDARSSSVNVTGRIEHVITDKERTSFRLNDAQLKAAINAYFGSTPNDAYLHSSTPWGDLYSGYGWPEVKTVLLPKRAQILEITSEPILVARSTFVNNLSRESQFNTSITSSVANNSTNTWSQSDSIEVSQSIKYELGFLGSGAEGETTLTYSHQWGVGGSESVNYEVGTSNGATVSVPPYWGVQSRINASRGKMKIRITYEAHLEGCTAVNYNPAYRGHHFWCLDIGSVMGAGGVTNSIEFTDDIEVGFYSDINLEVKDYLDLVWSYTGPLASKSYCTLVNEPADPNTWSDNYLCSSINHSLQWSHSGPITDMKCTAITESVDPHTWDDNYLCVPKTSQLNFVWSSAGPIAYKDCIQVNEPGDPYTWNDNYLCY
ncbi:hypothetical protein [Hyalangium versicolor]|uniref:hypothetical protein n=1 Tax=Hyalangium versicolor TaxID=2861190 RepID=UPI001CCADBCA|nr:hypothetical protein [Hyalangium versicolor]